MILQSLVQYYEALEQKGEITRPGWCIARVSFALELSPNGDLKRIISLKNEVPKGKKTVWEPQKLKVPQMITRSSGVTANFLCDNSSYFLGIDNKGKPERSRECFLCAKEKHLEILRETDCPAAEAVKHYFESWDPDKAEENCLVSEVLDEITAGANLVFWVEDEYVHTDTAVVEAWENYRQNLEEGITGTCLVTGKKTEIARIHGNIKGVQGAQSSGAALVSFNAPAFESYGKEQSYNAPVGNYAVYAYTTALNHLLADRRHVSMIGDTTIVYWSEDGEEAYQDIFLSMSEPTMDNCEIVDGVFKNLESGKAVNISGVAENLSLSQKFYILGLAPNAARIAVRFFYQDSFGNILKNLKAHYDRMDIIRPQTDGIKYLGVWRMLMETVNKKSRDKKPVPNMAGAVYRAIISGDRYPDSLFQSVMGRIRSEQDDSSIGIYKITRGRAAIDVYKRQVYEEPDKLNKIQLASENWDCPVVVTTNVQFFESLFSNKTSKCRKLHNITNSVIIFDEAQMLPVNYLKPCVQAISELVYNYHSTAVLCTATQPSLQSFFPPQLEAMEICPEIQEQYAFFRRTVFRNAGEITEEFLVNQLKEQIQVLCILNSRKKVQQIFNEIKETEGTYHLSTFMYPRHRKKVLAEIRNRLKMGLPCRLIATSLVEAGVDFDFPVSYTHLAAHSFSALPGKRKCFLLRRYTWKRCPEC